MDTNCRLISSTKLVFLSESLDGVEEKIADQLLCVWPPRTMRLWENSSPGEVGAEVGGRQGPGKRKSIRRFFAPDDGVRRKFPSTHHNYFCNFFTKLSYQYSPLLSSSFPREIPLIYCPPFCLGNCMRRATKSAGLFLKFNRPYNVPYEIPTFDVFSSTTFVKDGRLDQLELVTKALDRPAIDLWLYS